MSLLASKAVLTFADYNDSFSSHAYLGSYAHGTFQIMGCIQSELRTSTALLPLVQWLENTLYFSIQVFSLIENARLVSNPVTGPRHISLKGGIWEVFTVQGQWLIQESVFYINHLELEAWQNSLGVFSVQAISLQSTRSNRHYNSLPVYQQVGSSQVTHSVQDGLGSFSVV